jgi:lysine 2,3-aminomutase
MEQQTDSSTSQYQIARELNFDTDDPPHQSSEKTQSFRKKYYPYATQKQWDDWKWQVRNSITSYEELTRIFGSLDYELSEDINLPLRITPYYASTVTSLTEGIGKCVIPTNNELTITSNELNDSLHEKEQSPVECIVHRYPDRVLFLTTNFCSSYCRYCCRSRLVSRNVITRKMWEDGFEYIQNHEEIRDVIVSGGDVLTLEDNQIEYILCKLRSIKHIEIIRIGTKVVTVLPMRITTKLAKILRKYRIFVNIHFSHPDEITSEVMIACDKLVNNGIVLNSQTVLLKGVNDDVETMKKLMHKLLIARVRPYYLYMCDLEPGTSHFRTTVNLGLQIMQSLRGWTSGLACPTFVLDSRCGKIEICDNIISRENNNYELKTYEGKILKYEGDV